MRAMKTSLLGSVVCWGVLLLTAPVRAGGPLTYNEADGQPFRWTAFDEQNRPIFRAVFFVEAGDLGTVSNQDAATAVRKAFQTWANVPTSALQIDDLAVVAPDVIAPFKKDLTEADFTAVQCDALDPPFPSTNLECELIRACVAQRNQRNCPSPVIFDKDGKIFDLLFGENNAIIGLSGPLFARNLNEFPPPVAPPLSILQAEAFLNGQFFDGDPNTPLIRIPPNAPPLNFPDDPKGDRFLPGILTHEIGHFLGLAHNVVNGNVLAFNPALSQLDTVGEPRQDSPASVDALVSVPLERVETMFPLALLDQDQRSFTDSLERDDQATLSALYPCTAQARTSGSKCSQDFSASTGTISGRVFIQNASKPAQGVVVVARRVNDPSNPDSALTDAVSQLTGNTFAPRRCVGTVVFDGDGDGNPDNDGNGFIDPNNRSLSGLFGACSTPTQRVSTECLDQTSNLTLPGLKAFPAASGASFLRCGFSSGFGFSAPSQIPSDVENRYQITGLPPGEYIIQAIPPIIGGFSSPVRSSFGPSIPIRSDDNVSATFFPNPQTGEFYNGPPNGCGTSSTTCGNETGDRADNPFAFTRIKVAAGGPPVENVNIFLNAGDTPDAIFSDPGFDYCGLGDVNADGIVDERDIFAVVKAKAAFDKEGTLQKRADINGDGKITFLDVDIITDLAANPDFVFEDNPASTVRQIASFAAICVAAKTSGCKIQAPQERIGPDGKPTQVICNFAAAVDCKEQVIGCQ